MHMQVNTQYYGDAMITCLPAKKELFLREHLPRKAESKIPTKLLQNDRNV